MASNSVAEPGPATDNTKKIFQEGEPERDEQPDSSLEEEQAGGEAGEIPTEEAPEVNERTLLKDGTGMIRRNVEWAYGQAQEKFPRATNTCEKLVSMIPFAGWAKNTLVPKTLEAVDALAVEGDKHLNSALDSDTGKDLVQKTSKALQYGLDNIVPKAIDVYKGSTERVKAIAQIPGTLVQQGREKIVATGKTVMENERVKAVVDLPSQTYQKITSISKEDIIDGTDTITALVASQVLSEEQSTRVAATVRSGVELVTEKVEQGVGIISNQVGIVKGQVGKLSEGASGLYDATKNALDQDQDGKISLEDLKNSTTAAGSIVIKKTDEVIKAVVNATTSKAHDAIDFILPELEKKEDVEGEGIVDTETITLYSKTVERISERLNKVKDTATDLSEKAKEFVGPYAEQAAENLAKFTNLNAAAMFAGLHAGKYIHFVQDFKSGWPKLVSPSILDKLDNLMQIAMKQTSSFRDLFTAAWGRIQWNKYAEQVSASAGELKPYVLGDQENGQGLFQMPAEMMKLAANIVAKEEDVGGYGSAIKELLTSVFDICALIDFTTEDAKKDG